jgi:simple sugar transport system ATP-binding protein
MKKSSPTKTQPKLRNSKLAVKMVNITKTFGGGKIFANKDVNFDVIRGEIHAIVGENGAGKSTLMSILFGLYKPDSGKILINGRTVNFNSASEAQEFKLGMVHQHFKLVNVYTLLENIILGAEITKHGFLDKRTAARQITKIAHDYNLPITLNRKVYDASVGEQQRVEILKLLYRGADILIFDEPTAVLSDEEIKGFLKMLLEFKKQGKTVILITHKLNEVIQVADRATVIRRGMVVQTYNVKKINTSVLAIAMVGKRLETFENTMLDKTFENKPVALEIKNLTITNQIHKTLDKIKNLSLKVHQGEIIGIAGIEGNGQSELALAITGLLKPKSGEILFYKDKNKIIHVEKASVNELYKDKGIANVPEDRHKYGLILDDTVAMNTVLQMLSQRPFSRFGFVNKHEIYEYSKHICNEFDVRGTAGGNSYARALSGGNQQKLVLGREITRKHKLIIFVQPVRGLDIGAINFIHKKIAEDANRGAAVILISYEIDEILNVASRVVIMDSGKIVYDKPTKHTNKQLVGQYLSRTANEKNAMGVK